jgi:hypothetical protein
MSRKRRRGKTTLSVERLELRALLTVPSAAFIGKNTTTQGNWIGTFGSQGYDVIGSTASIPSYATVTPSGESSWTWATSTTDQRALRTSDGTSRIAACWYSASSFTVHLNLTDGLTHDLELYFLDWGSNARGEQVTIKNASTGAVLNTETLSSFNSGVYLEWAVSGNVLFTITRTSGANAVLSGLLFDAPAASAAFIGKNTTTQGNWIGSYGSQGYDVIGSSASIPSYATVTPSGESSYTWATSTTDQRALKTANGTGRIAACWYSATSFTVDVNLTDGLTHDLELYFLDWGSNARGDQVTVTNATTKAVLSTETVSSFHSGVYLEWAVSGNVLFTFTRTSGANAVLSGLFFDPAVPLVNVTAYHQASPQPSPPSTVGAGVNSNETILTPANVNSTDFGKLFATTVDGQVYAEPLYMQNVDITTGANQGTHSVVFVATENESLYAIDAQSGTVLWKDALLIPEHKGKVTAVPSSAVNDTTDLSPEIGITATPVIDPSTGTIFVENQTQEVASDGTHFENHLYAINIASGAISKDVLIADSIGDTVVSGPSVMGSGDGSANGVVKFDALRQMDRPALTLVNGNIYLAYGSHGDNPPYHGWVLGYSESTFAPTAVFNADPNGSDSGIWQSGGTLAYETVSGKTYLYFETGNGTFETTLTPSPFNSSLMIPNQGDYGDSFVKVEIDGSTPASGSLNATNNINGWGMHVADYFTPDDEGTLNAGDTDLGSGAPLLLPAGAGSAAHPKLMVGSGKEGRIYLIDRDNMGGYHGDAAGDGNSGFDNVVQVTAPGTINASFDTPTFYHGVLYYVGGYGDVGRTFNISGAVISSTSTTQSADSYPFPGSTATISTNPTGGNAIVWDIAGPGTDQLRAYNASHGYSSEIYTSAQAANNRDSLGSSVKFTVPTVANGEVFVGTTNSVVAYGLISPAAAAVAGTTSLSASAVSGSVSDLPLAPGGSVKSNGSSAELTAGGARKSSTVVSTNYNAALAELGGARSRVLPQSLNPTKIATRYGWVRDAGQGAAHAQDQWRCVAGKMAW